MSAVSNATIDRVLPIHNPAPSSSRAVHTLEFPVQTENVYIDFPPEMLSAELVSKGVISREGIYLKAQGAQKELFPKHIQHIENLKKKTLHLQVPKLNEHIEISVEEILDSVGAEHYLVGSEIFYILGKEWILNFFLQYVNQLDHHLFEQFNEESSDFDFRSKIGWNEDCRLKAEEVIKGIARKCNLEVNKLCHTIRMKGQTFTAYHPFFKVDARGDIEEDTFLVSTKHKVGAREESFDFSISRIYPGDVLSTQNIQINISHSKPILCGEYQQAIIDRVLKQYRHLRYTPRAWSRSIVMHCESYSHKNKILPILYENVRKFCDEWDTVDHALFVLFENYIKKHFNSDPNAIVSLAFNACASLYQCDFEVKDLQNFWQRMNEHLGENSGKLTSFNKNVLKWACSSPFDEVMLAVQLSKFIDLCFKRTLERDLTKDCDYIVTHESVPHVASKQGGFTFLVPIEPSKAVLLLIKKLRFNNLNKIKALLKGIIKTCSFKKIPENILCVNFSNQSAVNQEVQKNAAILLEHAEPSIRLLGFQLIYVCYQLNPSSHQFEKLLQKVPFILSEFDHEQKKNVAAFFLECAPTEALKSKFKQIEKEHEQFKHYLRILAEHYPHLLIEEFKFNPNALKDYPEIIKIIFQGIKNCSRDFSKFLFNDLTSLIKHHNSENMKDVREWTTECINSLIGNKNKIAALLLHAVTKAKILLNNPATAKLWTHCIDKIAETDKVNAERMILLANHFKVWNINTINSVSPNTFQCLQKLLKSKHRTQVNAAIAFLNCCNIGIGQDVALKNLKNDAEEITKTDHENISRIRREYEDFISHAKNEIDEDEFEQKFTRIFQEAMNECQTLATMILTNEQTQLAFIKLDRHSAYLGLLNQCIDACQKNCNEDIHFLLEIPFRIIIRDQKCPEDDSSVRFINYLIHYLLTTEETNGVKDLLENVKSNTEPFLLILNNKKKGEVLEKLLLLLSRHINNFTLSSEKYLKYFQLMANNPNRGEFFALYSRFPFPDDRGPSDEFVNFNIEIIDSIFELGEHDILRSSLKRIIEYLNHCGLSYSPEIAHKYLSWARRLIVIGQYDEATSILNIIEHRYEQVSSQLCSMINDLPETILRMSPTIFCQVVNVVRLEEAKCVSTRKANTLVLHLLKDQVSEKTVKWALNILSITSATMNDVMIKTMECTLKFNNNHLRKECLTMYKAKLLNFETVPNWAKDPTLLQRWLKGWKYSLELVKSLRSERQQFFRDQIDSALAEGSVLNNILFGPSNFEGRENMLITLIKAALENPTLELALLRDCEKLILNLDSGNKVKEMEGPEWNECEQLMLKRFLLSENLALYIQACNCIIAILKFEKDSIRRTYTQALLPEVPAGLKDLLNKDNNIPKGIFDLIEEICDTKINKEQFAQFVRAFKTHEILDKIPRDIQYKMGTANFREDVFQLEQRMEANLNLSLLYKLNRLVSFESVVRLHNHLNEEAKHSVRSFFFVPIYTFLTGSIALNGLAYVYIRKIQTKLCPSQAKPISTEDYIYTFLYAFSFFYFFQLLCISIYGAGKSVKSKLTSKKND